MLMNVSVETTTHRVNTTQRRLGSQGQAPRINSCKVSNVETLPVLGWVALPDSWATME